MGTIKLEFGAGFPSAVDRWVLWVSLIFSLCLEIGFYLLRSIGLYTLARRQGLKNAFWAWVPCAWLYTACKLIGNVQMFGVTFSKIALWAAIGFAVAEGASLAYSAIRLFPYLNYFFLGGTVNYNLATGVISVDPGVQIAPPNYPTSYSWYMILISTASSILRLVTTVITITMYISLFRRFWPQYFILAGVLSAFGLFPIFAFIIRNNSSVDYSDYYRSRYGANNYDNRSSNRPPDPFGEFSKRNDDSSNDPFGEFSGKDDDDFFN